MTKGRMLAILVCGAAFGITMALREEVGGFWMRVAIAAVGGTILAALLIATKK